MREGLRTEIILIKKWIIFCSFFAALGLYFGIYNKWVEDCKLMKKFSLWLVSIHSKKKLLRRNAGHSFFINFTTSTSAGTPPPHHNNYNTEHHQEWIFLNFNFSNLFSFHLSDHFIAKNALFTHTQKHTLEYGCIIKTCKLLLFIKNLSQEQNKQKKYADASVSQWRKNLYENFYAEISILDKFNLCIKMNSGNNRLNREKN